MWKYTAQRYRNQKAVVGYDLMVEPNSNHVWLHIFDPFLFYANYEGTLYDWNQFFPHIITAIRSVDPTTPILVGGMSYGPVSWLPYMIPVGDQRTLYTVHQYEPFEYTTQAPPLKHTYPGRMDIDYDGDLDPFNKTWMNQYFSMIDRFKAAYHKSVAANEFGVMRWEPGAAQFMMDEMNLFEQRGMNHALWVWSGSWKPINEFDDFDFLHGPDPNHHTDVKSSSLLTVIKSFWSRNRLRPGNVVFTDSTEPALQLPFPAGIKPLPAPLPAHRLPLPRTRIR
jgi:hypothetical protein